MYFLKTDVFPEDRILMHSITCLAGCPSLITANNSMMSGCPALYFVSAGIYQLTDIDERTSLFPD